MSSMSQESSFIVAVLIPEKGISVLLDLMVHYKLKQPPPPQGKYSVNDLLQSTQLAIFLVKMR